MAFFSIVIPSYNRAEVLRRSIQSVIDQTFSDFELIVIDDGSTDETKEVVFSYIDKRLKYYYQTNTGVSFARNRGANLACADWILFLDSDDLVLPGWLMDFKILIEKNKDITLAFCQVKILKSENESNSYIINPRTPSSDSIVQGNFLAGGYVLRRDLFQLAGGFDEALSYSENTELSFRIWDLKPKFDFVDNPNIIYKQSIDGGSKNWYNKYYSNLHILRKHVQIFDRHKKVKQLYLQVAAVSAIKLGYFLEGRKLMSEALLCRPITAKSWLRWLCSRFPIIAKVIWK